ncbi:MAG: hypothetical protein LAT55_13180 [Opitutales bacterium]|nr:hypothetical protein [Opitutales bacterium]
MTDEETLILKTDTLGRVRMPRERREAILDEFESSGMSGQAFAKRIGVKYPTFASWRQQRRRRQSGSNPAPEAKPGPTTIQLFEEVETAEGVDPRILDFSAIPTPTGNKSPTAPSRHLLPVAYAPSKHMPRRRSIRTNRPPLPTSPRPLQPLCFMAACCPAQFALCPISPGNLSALASSLARGDT